MKNLVDIDRTVGSPATKMKNIIFHKVTTEGTPASGTPSSAIIPPGASGNFPTFPKEYFPDVEDIKGKK